ncbi:MAG TPA: hypothetical protein VJV97_04750 [Gemmatimonadaceae bacterium]|nr:hypothetical protein [Gemmatimonadaceae bacterium]
MPAKSTRAIDHAHLLCNKAKPLLAGATQVARDLEKRDALHVVWHALEQLNVLDIDQTAVDEASQRFARGFRQTFHSPGSNPQPKSMQEVKTDRERQQHDLDQHDDVE